MAENLTGFLNAKNPHQVEKSSLSLRKYKLAEKEHKCTIIKTEFA